MTIEVSLSEAVFRRFTTYDLLKRRKVWIPSLRTALLLAIAGIAALFWWWKVGALLLILAMALPTLFFFNFYRSMEKQIRTLGLKEPKYAYTLELTDAPKGIGVRSGREKTAYRWDKVVRACRDGDAVYLYVGENQAFLLPGGDQEALWALIRAQVPDDRCLCLN